MPERQWPHRMRDRGAPVVERAGRAGRGVSDSRRSHTFIAQPAASVHRNRGGEVVIWPGATTRP